MKTIFSAALTLVLFGARACMATPVEPLLYTVSIENKTSAANGGLWAYEPIVSDPEYLPPTTFGNIHSFIDFSTGGTWVTGTSMVHVGVMNNEVTIDYDIDWNVRGGSGWANQAVIANARVDIWAPVGDTVRIARIPELQNNGFTVRNNWYREETAVSGGYPFSGSLTVDGVTYGQISAFGLPAFPVMGDIEAGTQIIAGPSVGGGSRSLTGSVTFVAENLSRQPEPCNCMEAIKNSVMPSLINGDDPTTRAAIKAEFVPNGGITVRRAEELCNVDEFRWQSALISSPENFQHQFIRGATLETREVTDVTPPIIDPPVESGEPFFGWNVQIRRPDGYIHDSPVKNVGWDSKPFYYKDGEDPPDVLTTFYDRPSFPEGSYYPGGQTEFFTQLVGEKDGELIEFPLTWDIGFIWSSNAEKVAGGLDGETSHLSGFYEGELPTGETRLLGYSSSLVPEPSAIVILLSLGLAGLGRIQRASTVNA